MLRLVLFAAVIALPSAGRAGDVLAGVDVQGNTRTDRGVIVAALRVEPGDRIDDALLPELRQRVLNLRIFQEVHVTKRASDAGLVLVVRVRERWTLIPLPILAASRGTEQAGVAVFESNLLGRRKFLAVSGIQSSRGPLAFVTYRDPSLVGTRALLAADLLVEDKVRERADGREVVYAFEDRRSDVSVRPGVLVGPRLAVRAGPFAVLRESRRDATFAAPPHAGPEIGLAADVEYEGQDYLDWFNVGPYVRASVRRSLPALGSERSFTRSQAQLAWSVPVLAGHAASLSVSALLAHGDPVLDAFGIGGRPGARGFRAEGLWVERGVTTTVDYQVPMWRAGWGTLTAIAFVDGGVATWAGARTRWAAPGAGVRIYVRNFALPALGLDLAWSSATDELAPSFFVGFR